MFQSTTIIREPVLSLAKVVLKRSVKLCSYRLCGGVAACLGVACVLCAVQNEITILFWESYFLPFSAHAQTNVIYLTLLYYSRFFNHCVNFFIYQGFVLYK
jgi:hypothetical protein